jgi:hypothetical protein
MAEVTCWKGVTYPTVCGCRFFSCANRCRLDLHPVRWIALENGNLRLERPLALMRKGAEQRSRYVGVLQNPEIAGW